EDRNNRSARSRSSRLEWGAGFLGLSITLAILGYLGWQAVNQAELVAPAIEIEVESVSNAGPSYVVEMTAHNRAPSAVAAVEIEVEVGSDAGPSYVVEITAHNRARSAVAAVEIEGALTSAGGAAETGRVTFDYIPGGSSVRGGLHFSTDPRVGDLSLRSVGHV